MVKKRKKKNSVKQEFTQTKTKTKTNIKITRSKNGEGDQHIHSFKEGSPKNLKALFDKLLKNKLRTQPSKV